MSHFFVILLVLSALPCITHAAHHSEASHSRGRAVTAPATLIGAPEKAATRARSAVSLSHFSTTALAGAGVLASHSAPSAAAATPLSKDQRTAIVMEKWLALKIAPISPRESTHERVLVRPRLTTRQQDDLADDLGFERIFPKRCTAAERERIISFYTNFIPDVAHYCRLWWSCFTLNFIDADLFDREIEALFAKKEESYRGNVLRYGEWYCDHNDAPKLT